MRFIPQIILALLVTTLAGCVHPGTARPPELFGESPGALSRLKARIAANDPALQPALKRLLTEADTALQSKPQSVMDKPHPGASGDKHDYYSIGPYWWPDPTKPDGLPYIRHDGQHNPERHKSMYDQSRMGQIVEDASTLALAYYVTDKNEYAEHAAKLLRVFFLDPATRMNPNMNLAQAIPGVNTGRGIGMIDSAKLTAVADTVALLAHAPAWSEADDQGMKAWFNAFIDWALTSKNGKEERAAKNNHGTFYDVQITHLALATGRTALARQIIEGAKKNRLDPQLSADGGQPLELAREDSFGYSSANLRGYFILATFGEHVGVDLWHYRTSKGTSIRGALDFLMPYVEQPGKPWPYERSVTPRRTRLEGVLWQAYAVYHDERYRAALKQIPHYESEREAFWYPQP